MKVKLIDLFNRIANKKSVPKKIIFEGIEFEYCDVNNFYYNDGWSLYRVIFSEGNSLDKEVEIVVENQDEVEKKQNRKVPLGFHNIQEDSMGWTYIEEGSCKYYIPVAIVNRLTSLAEAVNYLLDKEGE